MHSRRSRELRGYLIAIGATAGVVVLRFALDRVLGRYAPLLPFVIAITATAGYGGLKPGLLATALCTIVGVYFFVEPRYSFTFADATHGVDIALFVGVGVLVSWLCETLHRSRGQLEAEQDRLRAEVGRRKQAEERLDLLLQSAIILLTGDDGDRMLRELHAKIGPHLGSDVCFAFLVDEAGHDLRLASCIGVPEETARRICQFQDQSAEMSKSFGMSAFACYPLMSADRPIGRLAFASRSRGVFDSHELDFLKTITHYLSAAYERLRLIDQLRKADCRKDEFLATLAHELGNSLAPMTYGLRLIEGSNDDGRLVADTCGMMGRQLRQMTKLVEDLRDISGIKWGKVRLCKKRVELAAVVEDSVAAARPLIEASAHELTLTLPTDPIYFDADPARLTQVFSNLLTNAAKYTDNGGRIWLTAERHGSEVVVSVRDTGMGIAADVLPRIFEIFSQSPPAAERSRHGFGIGLALVRGLVQSHGGTVEAKSGGPGKGSEFTVRLPVAESPDCPQSEPEQENQENQALPGSHETTSGKRLVTSA